MNRISAIAISIVSVATALSAKSITLGIDGTVKRKSQESTSTETSGTETHRLDEQSTVFIMPRLSIRTGDRVSLVPAFGVGYSRVKEAYKGSSSLESEESSKAFMVGMGFGVEFSLIQKEWFELSLGPRATFLKSTEPISETSSEDSFYFTTMEISDGSYSNRGVTLDAPLNMDFQIGQRFGIRLATKLISYSSATEKFETVSTNSSGISSTKEYRSNNNSFTVLGVDAVPLSAGIFFRL